MEGVDGSYGEYRAWRGVDRSDVKFGGSPAELHVKLCDLSEEEEGGIPSVAVECVDIRRTTSGEGGRLDCN